VRADFSRAWKLNREGAKTGSEKPPRSTRKRNGTEANEGNEATFCGGRGFPAPRKKQKKATDEHGFHGTAESHPQISPITPISNL
jgi:hypothetical protein